MKRLLITAALATLVLGSSPSPAAAEANVQLETGSAEINGLFQGCDELIRVAGTMRFVYMSVSSAADTSLSNVHIVDTNVVGVGETSGTTYRLVYVKGETRMLGDGLSVVESIKVTSKLVGGGKVTSFQLLGHFTRTPNGDITASFEDVKQNDFLCP